MLLIPLEPLYALHLLGWFPAAGLLAVVGMFWVIAVFVYGMAFINWDSQPVSDAINYIAAHVRIHCPAA